jgi:hypothetical protein
MYCSAFLQQARHHARACHWQARKPDGTPPDMERKADILVYEVLMLRRPLKGLVHVT